MGYRLESVVDEELRSHHDETAAVDERHQRLQQPRVPATVVSLRASAPAQGSGGGPRAGAFAWLWRAQVGTGTGQRGEVEGRVGGGCRGDGGGRSPGRRSPQRGPYRVDRVARVADDKYGNGGGEVGEGKPIDLVSHRLLPTLALALSARRTESDLKILKKPSTRVNTELRACGPQLRSEPTPPTIAKRARGGSP